MVVSAVLPSLSPCHVSHVNPVQMEGHGGHITALVGPFTVGRSRFPLVSSVVHCTLEQLLTWLSPRCIRYLAEDCGGESELK